MYSIGIVVTVLIGGLIATTVASNDGSLLCYLQKLDGKLDNMESKLDTLQKQCCKSTTGGSKPKRTRDPSTIGSSPKKTITSTGFYMLWNIFITDDGIVYLPDFGGKLHTLDSDGNILKEVSVPGQPTSINVHGDEVYVADIQDKIRRYTKDLVPISSKDFNSDSPSPASLAVDSNGNIYVVAHFKNKVNIYKDDGSKSGEIDFKISHPNKYLRTIRFDAKENLFGSSYYESSILAYTKAGTLVNKFTISGVTYTVGPFIDDNGNIYVADSSNGMVYILNSSGTVIKSFQSAAESVSDIALAPDGTLWILEYDRPRIHLY